VQRHAFRPHRRAVLTLGRRDRGVLQADPGWRHLREPQGRSDHGSVAGHPELRRMEGLGDLRRRRRWPVVPAELSARAVPHADPLTSTQRVARRAWALARLSICSMAEERWPWAAKACSAPLLPSPLWRRLAAVRAWAAARSAASAARR